MRIGGGGWLTGLDISADGVTRVVRTDTYGAYVWDTDSKSWRQLVTKSSLPTHELDVDRAQGVFEIRVAPSDAGRLYMAFDGRIFRSDNQGTTWSATTFRRVPMDPNDPFRTWGEKLAVDPANPDVVYVGTPRNGLFVTRDGGVSWQSVEAVPAAKERHGGWPGITGIAFDSGSGTASGLTRGILVASSGHGVYYSGDAGDSWQQISGGALGGPSSVVHAAIAGGVYYVTAPDAQGVRPNGVWRYSGGGWRDINPGGQYWHSIAVEAANPNRLVLGSDGGFLNISADGGTSWGGTVWQVARKAEDVPWLAWTQEQYLSNGTMRFDPTEPGRLWFAQGIGVWTTKLTPGLDYSITWTSHTYGIEQLVANAIAAPPGGRPVLASWDRALFHVEDPDVFPSSHGPTDRFNMGWQVDYTSSDPNVLVAFVSDLRGHSSDGLALQSSFSRDGGRTWARFPSMPPEASTGLFGFGTGAASSPDNVIWVPSNKKAPYFTKDGAQTWRKITLPGVEDTPDGWAGLHWAYYLNRHIVASDRVAANTFYLHHTPKGLFRSTDGGDSWNLIHGEVAPHSGFNALLRSVPSRQGHLFFSSGPHTEAGSSAPSGPFMRSVDGGVTWQPVSGVLEVHAFGFGAPTAPGGYPTLYIAGWVHGQYGIWGSDDEASSWTQIGDFPLGSIDRIKAIEGDKTASGIVYVGFHGSGYAYGTPDPGGDAPPVLPVAPSLLP